MGKEKLFSDRISIYFSNESLRSAVISFSSLLLPASFLAYRRVNLTIATPFQLKYNFFLKRKKKKRADRRAGSWNWINVTALLTVTCVRSTGQWENEANRQREKKENNKTSHWPHDRAVLAHKQRKWDQRDLQLWGWYCTSPSTMNFQTHRLELFSLGKGKKENQWLTFRQIKNKNSFPHDMAWPDEQVRKKTSHST